jgi:hypothetical protein
VINKHGIFPTSYVRMRGHQRDVKGTRNSYTILETLMGGDNLREQIEEGEMLK